MKGSLFTSSFLHTLAISAGLVWLGSPVMLLIAPIDTLPVDLVPISEFTQIQQGSKTAPMAETSAPVPTTQACSRKARIRAAICRPSRS